MEKEIEIVSSGEFIDENIRVKTITVRFFGDLKNEEILSTRLNDRYCYDNQESYNEYIANVCARRLHFEDKVKKLLDIDTKKILSFVCTNVLSEIYTIVTMEQIRENKENGYERKDQTE